MPILKGDEGSTRVCWPDSDSDSNHFLAIWPIGLKHLECCSTKAAWLVPPRKGRDLATEPNRAPRHWDRGLVRHQENYPEIFQRFATRTEYF